MCTGLIAEDEWNQANVEPYRQILPDLLNPWDLAHSLAKERRDGSPMFRDGVCELVDYYRTFLKERFAPIGLEFDTPW